MKLGFHKRIPSSTAINTAPSISEVPLPICSPMKKSMYRTKKPTTNFLNLGIHISIPPAICDTPKMIQAVVGIVSSREHGGCRKCKNLSAPIMKKRRLQMPTMILVIFIGFVFLWFIKDKPISAS